MRFFQVIPEIFPVNTNIFYQLNKKVESGTKIFAGKAMWQKRKRQNESVEDSSLSCLLRTSFLKTR